MRIPYNYALYLVTDSELCPRENLLAQVEGALKGGVTMVQLREKDLGSLAFYQTAVRMKALTDRYHVPLIINDRLDIALAVDAAGVHVGQSDLPASVVRRLVGPEKLVGVSASTVAEAVIAYNDGADYLGVGAVFPTSTKKDAVNIKDSIAMLTAIHAAVPIPMVGIGGINEKNIDKLYGTDIDGVAVVSALMCAKDPRAAAERLLACTNSL